MTFDLGAEAQRFGDEVQRLLDGVLPPEPGSDVVLRQVTATKVGLSFAVEVGTAAAGTAHTVPLLSQGEKSAELFLQVRLIADSADKYPAVSKSKFEIRIDRHPLLRLPTCPGT